MTTVEQNTLYNLNQILQITAHIEHDCLRCIFIAIVSKGNFETEIVCNVTLIGLCRFNDNLCFANLNDATLTTVLYFKEQLVHEIDRNVCFLSRPLHRYETSTHQKHDLHTVQCTCMRSVKNCAPKLSYNLIYNFHFIETLESQILINIGHTVKLERVPFTELQNQMHKLVLLQRVSIMILLLNIST